MTEPSIAGGAGNDGIRDDKSIDLSGDAGNAMLIREAIILAGGLGTRLRSAVPDLPKCMAPVAGRPFIAHVIDYYRRAGIRRFIFALGYMGSHFDEFLQQTLQPDEYSISLEDEPLGTGGAIRLAGSQVSGKHAIILNGDTFFGIDLAALSSLHRHSGADCTLTLKPMREFDRYGVVELVSSDDSGLARPASSNSSASRLSQGRVRRFLEKQYFAEGLINGGVYALDIDRFRSEDLPEKFSFEKDYLERLVGQRTFTGLVQDRYFIDIGIPADYERAQHELAGGSTPAR